MALNQFARGFGSAFGAARRQRGEQRQQTFGDMLGMAQPVAARGMAQLAQMNDVELARSAGSKPPPRDPAARQSYAMAYFIGRGWKPHQAAGIVGNLMQESGSGLNPNAVGDNGTAFGIGQWRHERLANLKSYAKRHGLNWKDTDAQLGFVDWELRNTEAAAGRRLMDAGNVRDATFAMAGFERPQGWKGWGTEPQAVHGWSNRLSFAQRQLGVAAAYARGHDGDDVDVTNAAAFRRWTDGLEAGAREAVDLITADALPDAMAVSPEMGMSRSQAKRANLGERFGDVLGAALAGLGAGADDAPVLPPGPNIEAQQQMFTQLAARGPMTEGLRGLPQPPRLFG